MNGIPALPLLLVGLSGFAAEPLRIDIGRFSQGSLEGWKTKTFKGETEYRLVPMDGRTVLRAVSRAQASGLYREQEVDLTRTPFLNWSWRVEQTLGKLDEHKKTGDDYPARLYVVVSGGLAFWRVRSINYVWASTSPMGSRWPNAYAGTAVQMVAVRSGNGETGRWKSEKRNLRDDLKRFLGVKIERIDAIALMTDTDNSQRTATAYYGDIFFTER